jgi:hypothetical protein
VEVWPPRALPPGILVSPPRYGWVSLWGMPEGCEDLLPELTGTLECAGVLFHVEEDAYWVLELYQDGRRVARLSSPAQVVEEMIAYDRAWEAIEQEGITEPDEDDLRRRAEAFFEAGIDPGEEVDPANLARIMPPGRSHGEALALLRAWDRVVEGSGDAEGPAFVEDALETFANYLGIRDAAWDARHDYETLAAGDYEDTEGLPQDWEAFVLLPAARQDLLMIHE